MFLHSLSDKNADFIVIGVMFEKGSTFKQLYNKKVLSMPPEKANTTEFSSLRIESRCLYFLIIILIIPFS
jgi:hypothetical protein